MTKILSVEEFTYSPDYLNFAENATNPDFEPDDAFLLAREYAGYIVQKALEECRNYQSHLREMCGNEELAKCYFLEEVTNWINDNIK